MDPLPPAAAAFETAVYDEPDDATARLVYADWVQDAGDDVFARWLREPATADVAAAFAGARPPLRSVMAMQQMLASISEATTAVFGAYAPTFQRLYRGFDAVAATIQAAAEDPPRPPPG